MTAPLRWWKGGNTPVRWYGHAGAAVVAELTPAAGGWTWSVDTPAPDAPGLRAAGTAETLDAARERADAEWRARGGAA